MFWLNDDRLLVIGRQKFDIRAGARPTRWFREKVYLYDGRGKGETELFRTRNVLSVSLFNVLPNDKEKVLVQVINWEFAADLYEVDLESYNSKRIYRGATNQGIFGDAYGTVRGRQELEGSGEDVHIRFSYRHPGNQPMGGASPPLRRTPGGHAAGGFRPGWPAGLHARRHRSRTRP